MKSLIRVIIVGLLFFSSYQLSFAQDNIQPVSIEFQMQADLAKSYEPDTALLNHRAVPVTGSYKLNQKKALWFGLGNVAFGIAGYFWSQEAWGSSSGKFHWKNDWTGDNLAQNDEMSHTVTSYNFSRYFQPVYQWLGLSPNRSMTFGTLHSALLGTFIEYPIDAYNPLQGLGVSDLMANYVGCGLALGQYHLPALKNFGLKLSFKQAPWIATSHGVAGTVEEFDNDIYWLTFRPAYKKIDFVHFGLGYSTNHFKIKVEREYYVGVGTTLPDVVKIISPKAAKWLLPLDMFFLEVHRRLD
jgi:hypothetical protein